MDHLHETAVRRGRSLAAAAAFGGLVLAGCTSGGDDEASSLTVGLQPSGAPVDDAEFRAALIEYEPSVESMEFQLYADDDVEPLIPVAELAALPPAQISPAECGEIETAMGLIDPGDTASGDLLFAVGEAGDDDGPRPGVPKVHVSVRVFEDVHAAAAAVVVPESASDCSGYATGGDGAAFDLRYDSVETTLADLDGVPGSAVRVTAEDVVMLEHDGDGGTAERDNGRSARYLYAAGPYVVMVLAAEFDDPDAVAAEVVSGFLDFVDAQ